MAEISALFTVNQTPDEVQRGLDSLAEKVKIAAPAAEAKVRLAEKFREIGGIIEE